MKCAKELKEMSIAATEAYRKKRYERQLIARTNSIALCEGKIAETLEACANEPNPIAIAYSTRIYFTSNEFGDKVFYSLKKNSITYADGTPSFSPDINTEYDFETLADYLKSYCYNVSLSETVFKWYGRGNVPCKLLVVTPMENLEC